MAAFSAVTTKYQQITYLFIALVLWHLFVQHLSQHYACSSAADNSHYACCGGLVLSHFVLSMSALSTGGR